MYTRAMYSEKEEALRHIEQMNLESGLESWGQLDCYFASLPCTHLASKLPEG